MLYFQVKSNFIFDSSRCHYFSLCWISVYVWTCIQLKCYKSKSGIKIPFTFVFTFYTHFNLTIVNLLFQLKSWRSLNSLRLWPVSNWLPSMNWLASFLSHITTAEISSPISLGIFLYSSCSFVSFKLQFFYFLQFFEKWQ